MTFTKNKPHIVSTLISMILLLLVSCQQVNHIEITQKHFENYANKSFKEIAHNIADSITIVDGDYQKAYSLDEYKVYYQWDSVFSPIAKIHEISSESNHVTLSVSTYSKRFAFLENSPLKSLQKISFEGGKIYQIEFLENPGANWAIWTARRDTLVSWIDKKHPELSGFIYDMTKTGAENYVKAIDLYNQEQN